LPNRSSLGSFQVAHAVDGKLHLYSKRKKAVRVSARL
jgi:hypothetical protein